MAPFLLLSSLEEFMILKEYKLEIIIGSALSFMSMYMFYQLMTIKPRSLNLGDKMSFEMIRPHKDAVNEFSLDGREVDSRFVNPFVKKDLAKNVNKNGTKPNLAPLKNKVADKKKENSKKVDEKKTGIKVNVVSRDPSRPLGNEDERDYYYNAPANPAATKAVQANKKNKIPDKKVIEQDQKTKSLAEFVDLLTDPKPERIGQLVTAIGNHEVNEGELHDFISKMLKSDKSNVQSVGIYLAYYAPAVESFQLVATNQDNLNPEVKAYSEQFLTSYTQPSKLPMLAQALQSTDIKVVVKAGEVIISGLQKIKSGQTIDYGARANRGNNEVKSASVLGYFLPIAESLKSSQNQTIAGIGNALSQQLSQFSNTP